MTYPLIRKDRRKRKHAGARVTCAFCTNRKAAQKVVDVIGNNPVCAKHLAIIELIVTKAGVTE